MSALSTRLRQLSAIHRQLTFALSLSIITIVTWCSSSCAQIPSIKESGDAALRNHVSIEFLRTLPCGNNPDIECQRWIKPDYHRENGNAVYREMRNPRCWYHWEVDKTGHIVRWRVESTHETDWWWGKCDSLVPAGERFSPWFGAEHEQLGSDPSSR